MTGDAAEVRVLVDAMLREFYRKDISIDTSVAALSMALIEIYREEEELPKEKFQELLFAMYQKFIDK